MNKSSWEKGAPKLRGEQLDLCTNKWPAFVCVGCGRDGTAGNNATAPPTGLSLALEMALRCTTYIKGYCALNSRAEHPQRQEIPG